MKIIENKKIQIGNQKSTYGELLKSCVNSPVKEGFSIEDIKKRLRILESINGEEIKLEDSDYTLAKQCVLSMRWGVVDKSLVEFGEDFLSAKK